MPQTRAPESPRLFVCTRCGTQYAAKERPPGHCLLCEDDGRATPVEGPAWTTLEEVARHHQNIVQRLDRDLYGVRTMPTFPAGQRAMLLRSPGGNVLWDCVTLIDEPTAAIIRSLGGLSVIAVSHPRYYSSVVEWSHAFGEVPVYLNAAGRAWMMRPDPVVQFWEGARLRLHDGITLVHHDGYAGGTILHWPAGAWGRGTLLTGDVLQVVSGRDRVGFLSSSAGLVPRSAWAVEGFVRAVRTFPFDRLYDASPEGVVAHNARKVVLGSAAEYVAAVTGGDDERDPYPSTTPLHRSSAALVSRPAQQPS